ncbi:MAG: NAD(P)H-quinone oxidoreductase subunit N [Oscillatoriales cyanobacterium SM2_2_1]|nr:NAD(P)H-quinone oxidoreductase subunit N [Oscillatoriales cyanobacterium SM2_2_1]
MPLITSRAIVQDLNTAGALAMLVPPEGGYEGRYQRCLRAAKYRVLTLSARGLGDVSSYLTGVHGVRPSHLGKSDIRTYFLPPTIQMQLAALPEGAMGLVLWLIEGKFLSSEELAVLAQIPALDARVKIVVEVNSAREVTWLPLTQWVEALAKG